MSHCPSRHTQRGRQRGLSIVELMIGIAIGMFIVAGATLMLTTQLGDNRRLLLEAQIQQDMRAAADMISRDIRRAGYWANSYRQVWPGPGALTNPYTRFELGTAPDGPTSIEYDRSTDEEESSQIGTDDNGVDAETGRPRERVGFKLNTTNQTIDYLLGGSSPWQALTDKEVLEITSFRLDVATRNLPVPCGANPQCPVLGTGGCPLVLTYRDVTINITARARHDPAVQRALRDNVRLRNGEQREVCPT